VGGFGFRFSANVLRQMFLVFRVSAGFLVFYLEGKWNSYLPINITKIRKMPVSEATHEDPRKRGMFHFHFIFVLFYFILKNATTRKPRFQPSNHHKTDKETSKGAYK
jgi:hypothetical protein